MGEATIYTEVHGVDQWLQHLTDNLDIVPILGIVMGGLFLIVLTCCIFGLSFIKVIRGGGATQKVRQLEAQETAAFQDLQRGFRRMEERLDSLEMLLVGPRSMRDSFQPDMD